MRNCKNCGAELTNINGICPICGVQNGIADTDESKSAQLPTWVTILMWVFLFPIMIPITIIRSKTLAKTAKIILTIGYISLVLIILSIIGGKSNPTSEGITVPDSNLVTDTGIYTTVETTTQATTAPVTETTTEIITETTTQPQTEAPTERETASTTRATTRAPVTKPAQAEDRAPVADSSRDVYRTPSGKRYHFISTCGGENSYSVSFENAISAGLTPCQKCAS